MRFFDTFTGIGGFTKGILDIIPNAECVGYSEIDKYATSIYKKHYKEHKNYGDITKINTAELPDFDLLVGGVPCQPWSVSGKRGGFEDPRGNMWWYVINILKIKQPKYFIFENVKGILSHDKGDSFIQICEKICEAGYVFDFDILNSKDFCVPQNRQRVFMIGFREDLINKTQII